MKVCAFKHFQATKHFSTFVMLQRIADLYGNGDGAGGGDVPYFYGNSVLMFP